MKTIAGQVQPFLALFALVSQEMQARSWGLRGCVRTDTNIS